MNARRLRFLVLVAAVLVPGRLERGDALEMGTRRDGPVIALVFDDLGYSTGGLARSLLDLPCPLTFAVLPGLAGTEAFAEAARTRGHEVICHLPMEPLDARHHDPGPDAVRTKLPLAENRARLRRMLGGLSKFTGVSNHMGSRVTRSPELMTLVLREVKRHDRALYFLDSRTTGGTVVTECAAELGVCVLKNDLFLDHPDGGKRRPALRLRQLERIALGRGEAIGIGHVRPETVAALRRALPRWRAEGIELVRLSDLLHRRAETGAPGALAQGR